MSTRTVVGRKRIIGDTIVRDEMAFKNNKAVGKAEGGLEDAGEWEHFKEQATQPLATFAGGGGLSHLLDDRGLHIHRRGDNSPICTFHGKGLHEARPTKDGGLQVFRKTGDVGAYSTVNGKKVGYEINASCDRTRHASHDIAANTHQEFARIRAYNDRNRAFWEKQNANGNLGGTSGR